METEPKAERLGLTASSDYLIYCINVITWSFLDLIYISYFALEIWYIQT